MTRSKTSNGAGVPAPVAWYVGVWIFAAAVASGVAIALGASSPTTIALWCGLAIVSQVMIFPTLTGSGSISMSTTTHLAMILVLTPAEFVPALVLGRVVMAFVERKPWYRSAFNVAQIIVSVFAGWVVYRALGGTHHPTLAELDRHAPAFVAAALTYYVVNVAAVTKVICLSGGGRFLAVYRKNYGYRTELVGTAAMALLAPLVAFVYLGLHGVGLLLFVAPMVFIYDATKRYVELRRTQESLIQSERQAAKAELAADIGRDINNYLCIAQAQIQMVLLRKGEASPQEVEQLLHTSLEQIHHIDALSRGLLDFTRHRAEEVPTSLQEIVSEVTAFLGPQRRFQKVAFEIRHSRRAGIVNVDPFQIKQALGSLMLYAAEAMEKAESPERVISIETLVGGPSGNIEVSLRYSGPALSEKLRSRLQEMRYSPDEDRWARELFLVASVVRGHHGSIVASESPGGEGHFGIAFPPAKPVARTELAHKPRVPSPRPAFKAAVAEAS